MHAFAELFDALDSTNSTNAKVAAVRRYLAGAEPRDAAWGLFFLTGGRLKRLLSPRLLAGWACERAGVAEWMFEECYSMAGDLAETAALLIDTARGGANPAAGPLPLSRLVEEHLLPLREADEEAKRAEVTRLFDSLDRRELFLFIKLLTGELRVGVSATLAMRAVALEAGLEPAVVAHRMMGGWQPTEANFRALFSRESEGDLSRPYPFFLASPLQDPPESLGDRSAWLAEWKWDGIRAQLVKRKGAAFLWSRGEELITDRFPELFPVWDALPEGTVLDGEVLAFAEGKPLPFSVLQRRIGRQKLSPAILEQAPASFMAYDLLELEGRDLRAEPLRVRRAKLEPLVHGDRFVLSAPVEAATWDELAKLREGSRERAVEGLMLKLLDSPYRAGRPRGEWWKWKIAPHTIDAVLVYAQPGNGRRATILSDMTFAVWDGPNLVPIAKAYSGLSDEELNHFDKWIRQNTVERFGPVRAVKPEHVFELHFEAIARSTRHKSGIAVRFPRIARVRTDKKPGDADTLDSLQRMLPK
ncbi:MAG TPA: ATP-dependent DNA ligase [Myxococcales bacterium]|jgi:DNA ligase-1